MPQQDEAYQAIQAYIDDFRRELGDQATLKSSTMRAYNLFTRSHVDLNAFIEQLYASRVIVKERTAGIRSRGETSTLGPTKNKTAYFFAVLEDLLGLREESAGSVTPP